jgi:hypothetical protein
MPQDEKQNKNITSHKLVIESRDSDFFEKQQEQPMGNPVRVKNKKNLIIVVLAVTLLTAAGAAAYFYNQIGEEPQAKQQEELDTLLARVGQLLVLPEGEQPTIATVSDVNLLRDQPFFARAKNGYRVLIYTNARKAILYDPVAHKIVEIAPLNLGTNEGEAEPILAPAAEPVLEPSEEQ